MVSINSLKQRNPIVIVGAGITGCIIAQGLVRKGYKVILIEKSHKIGGLAKTFHYNDLSFDIGPHRFFTLKPQILRFIRSILKDEYIILPRDSKVYFLDRYYRWPLCPKTIFKLPLTITFKSGWELFLSLINNSNNRCCTFEDYILINYGSNLYNLFFKDYTEKFFGLSPKELHCHWAKEGIKRAIIDERIQSRNLFNIIKTPLNFKLKTEFIYPKTGIDEFCNRLAEEIKERNGEIWLNSAITYIRNSSERIEEIAFDNLKIKPQMLIWTGPLGEVCNLLKLPNIGFDYLSLLLFNIELNKPANKAFQWCYYGSKDIIFNRVTIPSLFSKNMSTNGKTGLCVEITCKEDDQVWNNPAVLIEKVKKDLVKVGLIGDSDAIEDIHIEKVCNAYPIYRMNYLQNIKKAKENLDKFKNFVLAGRTGLFWYNNMDDCIENGLTVVENILRS